METKLEINGREVKTILDTGAGGSIISEDLRRELGLPIVKCKYVFKGIGGAKCRAKGYVIVDLEYKDQLNIRTQLAVVKGEMKRVILGNDVLNSFEKEIRRNNTEIVLRREGKEVVLPVSTVKYQIEENEEDSSSEESSEESTEEDEEQNNEMEIDLLDRKKIYMEILVTNIETLDEDLKKEIWKNQEKDREFKEWKGWLIKRLDEVCNELDRRHQEYELEREKLEKKTITKAEELLRKWSGRINEEVIPEMRMRQSFCLGLITRILDWIEKQKMKK